MQSTAGPLLSSAFHMSCMMLHRRPVKGRDLGCNPRHPSPPCAVQRCSARASRATAAWPWSSTTAQRPRRPPSSLSWRCPRRRRRRPRRRPALRRHRLPRRRRPPLRRPRRSFRRTSASSCSFPASMMPHCTRRPTSRPSTTSWTGAGCVDRTHSFPRMRMSRFESLTMHVVMPKSASVGSRRRALCHARKPKQPSRLDFRALQDRSGSSLPECPFADATQAERAPHAGCSSSSQLPVASATGTAASRTRPSPSSRTARASAAAARR